MNRRSLALVALFALVAGMLIACSGAASAPDVRDEVGNPLSLPTAAPTAAPYPGDVDSNGVDQAPLLDQQLIVYTGNLDLEVTDINSAVTQAEQLISGLGGYVASSSATDKAGQAFASITFRFPAARWTEALNGLKALAGPGNVIAENTQSEDVTAQVVDLDARLTNLRTTETALQLIMDRATTITDVLKVQAELTKVRDEIERLVAQRDHLANQAALATLEVGFNTPAVPEVTQATESWDLGKEIDSAVAALVRLGQWAASLLVWLAIVIVPLFAPIILVIYIAYRLRQRWLRMHPTI